MKNAPIREEKKVITKQAAMRLNDDKLESVSGGGDYEPQTCPNCGLVYIGFCRNCDFTQDVFAFEL